MTKCFIGVKESHLMLQDLSPLMLPKGLYDEHVDWSESRKEGVQPGTKTFVCVSCEGKELS